jgi:hypothetical protein
VRVWDLPPAKLCRAHLLAQHNEIHGIWSIIVNERSGYANHPETTRWRGKLGALHIRHSETVAEMRGRGYRHNSPLPNPPEGQVTEQTEFVQPLTEQIETLRLKECACLV